MSLIGKHYQFHPTAYPVMRNMTPHEQRGFAISHSLHHMTKSMGRIATEVEKADHGESMDREVIKEGIVKMLVNTLKLAEQEGYSAVELTRGVMDLYKKK